jgi:exopolyphosphatase/guanosine-5'-triphosphate,3'-diphosphate pyrophosphatase
MAQTARYHRKSLPDPSHPDFMALPEDDREIVSRLAAILRIADGLDRQHLAKVASVSVTIADEDVTVTVSATGDVSQELAAAAAKSDLAERVFGKRFAFSAAD